MLKEIKEWIRGDDDRCVFWLSGMAGIGKTTIARTIVEQDKEIWVASFFFSRDDAQASDYLLVFPTLAHQLASRHRKVMTALAEMIRVNADCTTYPLNKQFNEFIAGPLTALGDSRRTILLILDALDECASKKGTSDILRLLLSHTSNVPYCLRILVTSRPEDHIRSIFHVAQNHTKIVLHDIEKTVVRDDIERYLMHGIAEIFGGKGLPMPLEREMKILADKADNLFLYAATALRFIGDEVVNDPQSQFAIILDSREEPDENPYSIIDDLYLRVLDAAVSQNTVSRSRVEQWTCNIIRIIVTIREPLPVPALAMFAGLTPQRVQSALSLLHSVILVPSSLDKAPRIFHPSFIYFVTDKNRCKDERFLTDAPAQEMILSHRCLELMRKSLKWNMLGIEDGVVPNIDVVDLEGRLKRIFPSELKYACLHWASHVMAI